MFLRIFLVLAFICAVQAAGIFDSLTGLTAGLQAAGAGIMNTTTGMLTGLTGAMPKLPGTP